MSVRAESDQLHELDRRERRGRAARRPASPSPKGRSGIRTGSSCSSATCRATRGAAGTSRAASPRCASPSNKGNGMTLDADGSLIVCEHVTSSVVRDGPDGTAAAARCSPSHYEGKELNSPNDVIVRSRRRRSTSPTRRTAACPGFGHRARAGARLPGRLPASRRAAATRSCSSTTSSSRTGSASRPTSRCSTSTTPTARTSGSSTSAPDGTLSNGRVFAEGIGTGRPRGGRASSTG